MFKRLLLATALSSILAAEEPEAAPDPPPAAAKPPQAPAAPAGPQPHKIGGITVSGSIRSRVESWDWFTPASGEPDYTFSGNLFRLMLSKSKETYGWQVELAVPFLLGLPDNAVAPGAQGALGMGANYYTNNNRTRNSAMLFPKQANFQFKNVGGGSLKLGRFEFIDGSEMAPKSASLAFLKNTRINQRLLGPFGFTHVMRSFDGAHYSKNFMGG